MTSYPDGWSFALVALGLAAIFGTILLGKNSAEGFIGMMAGISIVGFGLARMRR
ncbi:MAG: hypothetical protein ACREQF_07995 [Candidatus Binataceae bacterium]